MVAIWVVFGHLAVISNNEKWPVDIGDQTQDPRLSCPNADHCTTASLCTLSLNEKNQYRSTLKVGILLKYMTIIITTMIRQKPEYAEVIWSPNKKKHVLKLERIQNIVPKKVPHLEEITYVKRSK